jgi:PKD repeat protein
MFTANFFKRLITVIAILFLTLSSVQPALAAPTNDLFANATIITSLPFDDTVDTTGAVNEFSEPSPDCTNTFFHHTIWYRFTPTTRVAVDATVRADLPFAFARYTGNSLDNLTAVHDMCTSPSSGALLGTFFIAEPNTTYYFQIGSFGLSTDSQTFDFQLKTVSPPRAGFTFSPSDPSTFDTIQFTDTTPPNWFLGPVGVRTFTGDFGDGTTSTLEDPTHQYLSEGDYTVQHTTTTDGFTTSTSQVVQVLTHDVAITRVAAPSSANVGQTRPITVYIKNNRYAETVLLELYKSNPNVAGGFELVGSYTQFVPVRAGNRTSAFTFNYTFTAADLAVGKVTFKAVATIVNGHDAIPSDNELSSSPPTLVRR